MNDISSYINFKDNTKLSELSKNDLFHLLLLLQDYLIEYRDTLDIDKDITFGLEIEFEHADYEKIEELVNNLNLKRFPWTRTKWQTTQEISISDGGETKSPVLRDNINTWKQLKEITSVIKNYASIDNNAGGHIHIGKKILNDDIDSWKNFLKLWIAYENIIFRFGYGEYLNARPIINNFAMPISNKLTKDISYRYKSYRVLTRAINYNNKHYALNLDHLKFNCIYGSMPLNTIEFRNFNGTLNPIIWQNNVNFITKLLSYCNSYDFDSDIVDERRYQNKNKFKNPIYKYHQINIKQAIELVDLIFDNNLDKINFLKQYFKNYQTSREYRASKKLTKKI